MFHPTVSLGSEAPKLLLCILCDVFLLYDCIGISVLGESHTHIHWFYSLIFLHWWVSVIIMCVSRQFSSNKYDFSHENSLWCAVKCGILAEISFRRKKRFWLFEQSIWRRNNTTYSMTKSGSFLQWWQGDTWVALCCSLSVPWAELWQELSWWTLSYYCCLTGILFGRYYQEVQLMKHISTRKN